MTDQCNQLLPALENERRYAAAELHDGVAQSTLQLGLQVGICRKFLEQQSIDLLTNELTRLEKHCQLVSSQVRELISDLRPPLVEPEASFPDYILILNFMEFQIFGVHEREFMVTVFRVHNCWRIIEKSSKTRLAFFNCFFSFSTTGYIDKRS